MAWKPANLNEAVVYAKGWNDAVEAAAKIAEGNHSLSPLKDVEIARAIRELDRSLKACDD